MVASLVAGVLALSVDRTAGATGAPTFTSDFTYATPSYQPGPIGCSGAGTCLRLDFGDQWGQANWVNATVTGTSNGGATWKVVGTMPLPTYPFQTLAGSTLSCASSTVCLGDLDGQLDRTTDGGARWVVLARPNNVSWLSAACFPSGGCLALGTNFSGADPASYWAAPSGHTFARTSSLRGTDEFNGSMSCPSTTRCVAVTESGTTGLMDALSDGRFVSPYETTPRGWHYTAFDARSGDPVLGSPGGTEGLGTLQQGYLENSNVDVVTEFVQMVLAQRAYESDSKVVKAADDMYSQVNNMTR